MNEPAAYMTKEGHIYKKHQTRPIEADIPLYTKPFFSQKPVAMMVKIDGFDKPEFTTTCSSAALKHPNYTSLYDHPPIAFAELEEGQNIPLYEHPMREITDEEILALWVKKNKLNGAKDILDFARDLLKKASEK